jgi:DNA-binding GntR family transcriptional regulator
MKSLRSLFGIFIVVAAVYVGWLVVPIYMANYQLEEAMDDSVREAIVNYRSTDQSIRAKVMNQARALDIPLGEEQLHVERTSGGSMGSDVMIWGDYTVHVDLPFYPFDLHFQPASRNAKK